MTDEQFETLVKKLNDIDRGVYVVTILIVGFMIAATIVFIGSYI